MQDKVSTADSAEQRHELSHSHREGREEGVPHATHRHRPHTTQMIDSDPGDERLPGPGSEVLMSGCLGSEEEEERGGGEVITDAGAGATGATVMGRGLCEALRPERPGPGGGAAALKGVSTYRF